MDARVSPPTPVIVAEGPPTEGSLRNQLRAQRANAYLRRRLGNGAALLSSELLGWAAAAALTNTLLARWGFTPLPWAWLEVLLLIYAVVASLRVQPGWGLGAVTELERMVTLAALLVLMLTLGLALTEQGWAAVRSGALLLGLGLPAVLLARNLAKRVLVRSGLWGVPVVVYGAALTGQQVVTALQAEAGLGYHPVAVFDDNAALHGTEVSGVPVLGHTNLWTQAAPIAIVAMPGVARTRLVDLLDGPLSVYRSVILIPDLFEMQSLWVQARDLGGLLGLEITHNLADPLARRLKRGIDLLAVTLTLPLWLPLCGLIALLIWLEDRAKPLFLQRRTGLGGETFDTWKFRTMLPDAEEVLARRLAEDPALNAEWQAHFKLKNDPRITRIGGLLRKTSLDELPQLVNVLRGEMALVGPRPLPLYHLEELPLSVQQLRREVRPGMTGLWQVSGRSDAGNEGMVRLDPYYVRNWSVWLDIVILLRTVKAVLRSAGAY
ncbi:exopolysaccharide biosynthesis polyprenyl glycosylphosphotransferase [Deinococcus aquatilis]|uniref:exopolysaccharide biosynthesis polyprenyl glycosylphosphotransferase n=1 Tax=Deinococcus aquatilis TaxID=519440 RepID=UPI00037A9518|nr:exopolysaccharide biosynthesis polyprenyl glycosylphosphotransferase [Deinococcus aquatilis]